jgi:hypothetical protein
MKRSILAAALTIALLPLSAQASPIFVENFNTENGGVGALNYGSFANFAVSSGTVDLIGNGFFDFLPGNGLFVDLDGSTQNAGVLTSGPIALGPGSYILSFALAGNHRGGSESVDINIFGGLNASYAFVNLVKGAFDPFATVSVAFSVLANDSVQFNFANAGGDNIGALLDDIELTAVPEPGTLLLLGGGLAVAARTIRRRQTTRS